MERSFILVIGAPSFIDPDAITALQRGGDVCICAQDVERATFLAETFRAAAIVLDARLANESAVQALQRVGGAGRHIPILAVGATDATVAGVDRVVRNPCAPSDVAAAVAFVRALSAMS